MIKKYFNYIITNYANWIPFSSINFQKSKRNINYKIAYYLLRYPEFSQTFIQREISALQISGVDVKVFANKIDNIDKLDSEAKSRIESTFYINPIRKKKLKRYKKYYFKKNLFLYLYVFLFIYFHRYDIIKSYDDDKKIFDTAIYLAGLLRDNKIRHIHSPWANKIAFVSLIASKFQGITYSVEGRASDINRVDQAFALKAKFRNAKFIVTNSRYNRSRIESFLKENNKDKVYQIYEGIDLEKFNPIVKSRNDNSKIINVLCIGRFIEEKGIIYLLKACNLIMNKGISFNCEIVGGKVEGSVDDYFPKLQKLYSHLQLESNVRFKDAQPFVEIMELYKKADIFVLPCVVSKTHGGKDITPNVILEAMAMKLPVVSTNITAIPEIIENEVDGLLVLPENEHELAGAIIRLINDGELRKNLGENARKKIEEKFDINKNIKDFVKLFN